jgi:phage portal protein BeeE
VTILGLFDSIRRAFTTPAAVSDALARQGMDSTGYLTPGAPLTPQSGYSVPPRVTDYPVAVNQNVRNRSQYGRTSFDNLREMLRAYDFATVCMRHKIDEIRSMEPLFNPAEGYKGDAEGAIEAAKAALAFPDRYHPWDEWVTLWMTSLLTYGQGPLYRRRNYNGEVIGLHVIDGGTMYALIDENGLPPLAPAPAYQQVIKGAVDKQFTTQDVVWALINPQPTDPYGMAPLESILLTVNTDLRYQWHLLQMFTEGSIPGGFMEMPPDVSSPDQVAEWQDYWDATFMGDQSIVHKLIAVPTGSKFTETAPRAFDPLFPEWLAKKTAMAFGVVPQDLGFTADVNRANGETQVDIQFRVNTLPWVRMIEGHLTRYLQRDLGLPVEFKLNTGRDKEDRLAEANAWKIYIESGIASVDEAREELLGLPTDNQRPMPRGFMHARLGFVPLADALAISGKTDPETKAPTADAELPYPYEGSPGLVPDKLPGSPEFKRAPRDPDDPLHPANEHPDASSGVVNPQPVPAEKEATAGVTSATGITGVDLLRRDELKKFKAFVKARKRTGKWQDFEFYHHSPAEAAELNAVAKGDADPKGWRADPPEPTPFHKVDLTLTDHWAPLVAAALAGGVDTDSLAEDALEAGWTATEAADWAGDAFDTARLNAVLTGLHADGYLAGGLSAAIQMGGPGHLLDGFHPGIGIEFRVPQDVPTPALDALSGTAWRQAIADAGITLDGITDTTLTRMGALIERAVEAGHTVDQLAKDLDAYLSDPARAEMVAHTEIARMATNASLRVYRAYGLTQWDWVVSAGACPSCLDEASRNPHGMGDTQPPGHPRCRCAASPHTEEV